MTHDTGYALRRNPVRAARTPRLLAWCIGASIIAHGLALWYTPGLSTRLPEQAHGDSGLLLTLARAPAAESPRTTPAPQVAAAESAPPKPAPVAANPPSQATRDSTRHGTEQPVPVTVAPDNSSLASSAPALTALGAETASGASAGNPLVSALRTAMQPYFNYPLLARRHGWEGTVRVGLRVGAGGRITSLRIVESSHHAVLDQAAIDCLGRIRRLPDVVAWLGGKTSDIVLPVEYRLTDG